VSAAIVNVAIPSIHFTQIRQLHLNLYFRAPRHSRPAEDFGFVHAARNSVDADLFSRQDSSPMRPIVTERIEVIRKCHGFQPGKCGVLSCLQLSSKMESARGWFIAPSISMLKVSLLIFQDFRRRADAAWIQSTSILINISFQATSFLQIHELSGECYLRLDYCIVRHSLNITMIHQYIR
jgi:hypothetical protein